MANPSFIGILNGGNDIITGERRNLRNLDTVFLRARIQIASAHVGAVVILITHFWKQNLNQNGENVAFALFNFKLISKSNLDPINEIILKIIFKF